MERHRVWRVGEGVDTDALAPGAYMKLELPEMARHCLESRYPGLASALRSGDVIVAGPSFGIGSSREQAVGVLVQLGVKAVIAPSFSGLYFRNAFNLGLLAIVCPEADRISEGSYVEIDTEHSLLRLYDKQDVDGDAVHAPEILQCQRIPSFLVEMATAGGLLAQLQQKLSTT
ncbi:3-isopropylmalate dehydratase [Candidimonas sp. SYP-B2681]|uniref:LeuD/DmdB family oxidoreductase small subunit n=1 Tax=Candidimonas sp. SYP-B2681 TaxID=2497686 RepID=UPI000F86B75B|nr:3-isopropylmalate dehydratase [Candidimonas sp. SYP-B2681]RTZ41568.1 3-isopropylmalate dehydratase [Candidimonas sp. SYP-B2681]